MKDSPAPMDANIESAVRGEREAFQRGTSRNKIERGVRGRVLARNVAEDNRKRVRGRDEVESRERKAMLVEIEMEIERVYQRCQRWNC